MQYIRILFFVLFATGFVGCESEEKSGKSIQEIRSEDLGSNAAIIRSPISANAPIDSVNVAKMKFEETDYEFGIVEAGAVITHEFAFTNTGKVPLLINDVRSTCGCTIPEWPEELIAPGESSSIQVRFNTTNMRNQQKKPVTITANTYPAKTKLYLTGIVIDPKEDS
ncbi:MAG: DUF1573 domain-containing protein [Bacteroidota bacterium]